MEGSEWRIAVVRLWLIESYDQEVYSLAIANTGHGQVIYRT